MSGYGNSTSIEELLVAMRDAARQDSDTLGYVRTVEVAFPPLQNVPLNQPAIYLVWTGSPEESLGVEGPVKVKVATHQVTVYCVVYVQSHDDTAAILGDGRSIGIARLTEDTLDFFAGNLLGLTGLDAGNVPDIEAPANAHAIIETLDENWMHVVGLTYEARTKPFARS